MIDLFDLLVKRGPFLESGLTVSGNGGRGEQVEMDRGTIELEGRLARQRIPPLDGPLDRIVGRIEVAGRRTIVCDSRHHLAEVLDRSLFGGNAQFDAQIEEAGHEMVRLGLRNSVLRYVLVARGITHDHLPTQNHIFHRHFRMSDLLE